MRRLSAVSAEQRRIALAFAVSVLLFAFGQILHPGFAGRESVQTILLIATFVGLVAAGQMFVVLVGGIDLSVPWVLNGAAILMVASSVGQNGRAIPALLLTLAMGLAVGMVNGLGVSLLSVPPVVMTLGMNGIMEGLTLGLSGGLTCGPCASYAPPVVQELVNGRTLGVPNGILSWLLIAVVVSVALSATTFGRRVYAIGGNPFASYLAGVNVKLVTVALYMLSGAFSALAGIALVGFGGQAALGMGDPYLFQSIAAVVIGGVYILGGRGHYLGVVAGSVNLVALVSVLLAERMPDYGRSIVYGMVILAVLLLYGREREDEV
jgi:ribose transport system permease protein